MILALIPIRLRCELHVLICVTHQFACLLAEESVLEAVRGSRLRYTATDHFAWQLSESLSCGKWRLICQPLRVTESLLTFYRHSPSYTIKRPVRSLKLAVFEWV